MPKRARHIICLIDPDEQRRLRLKTLLLDRGYRCSEFRSPVEFLRTHDAGLSASLLTAFQTSPMTGLQLHHAVQRRDWIIPTILLADGMDVRKTVQAMQGGVFAVLPLPLGTDELEAAVKGARRRAREIRQRCVVTRELERRLGLLSSPQQDVLRLLLTGESIKSIAAALQISRRTVEYRKREAFSKLGVDHILEAAHVFWYLNQNSSQAIETLDESVLRRVVDNSCHSRL